MNYSLLATKGTADYLQENGVACDQVNKIAEGGLISSISSGITRWPGW